MYSNTVKIITKYLYSTLTSKLVYFKEKMKNNFIHLTLIVCVKQHSTLKWPFISLTLYLHILLIFKEHYKCTFSPILLMLFHIHMTMKQMENV